MSVSSHTKMLTVHTSLHFFDLAATNSWIQHRSDNWASGSPAKERLQHFDSKLLPADEMLSQVQSGANHRVKEMFLCVAETRNRFTRWVSN